MTKGLKIVEKLNENEVKFVLIENDQEIKELSIEEAYKLVEAKEPPTF